MDDDLINWTSDFEIGIKEIDLQHFNLVKLLNDLYYSFEQNSTDYNYLLKLVGELYNYTDYHFESEEKFYHLKNTDNERTRKHIQEHKKFLSKVLTFKKKLEKKEENLSLEIILFLKDWIIEHIMYTDRKFISFIQKQNNPYKDL
jgi:hemerythrin-like metal-binding protein